MNEFTVISIMNEAMLRTLKGKNANYEKNIKIKQYLEDESFFFKIEKEKAYEILQDVGVKQDQLERVYEKLTSKNMFYDLLQKGKIKNSDESLVIKYESFDRDDLFKKNKK